MDGGFGTRYIGITCYDVGCYHTWHTGYASSSSDLGSRGTFYDQWSQRWRSGVGTSGYCAVCGTVEYAVQQAQEEEFDRRYGGIALAVLAAPVAAPVVAEAAGGLFASNAVRAVPGVISSISRYLGPSGPVFGRSRFGGNAIIRGDNLRVGFGWKGSRNTGMQCFGFQGNI